MSEDELSHSDCSYESIQDQKVGEDFIDLSNNKLQDLLNEHFNDFINQIYDLSICCENLACLLVDKLDLLMKEADSKGFSTFKDMILKNPQTLSGVLSNQKLVNMLASTSIEFRKYEDIIELYVLFQNLLDSIKQLYSYMTINVSECSLLFCPTVSQKILHMFSSLVVISCIIASFKQKFIISTAFIFSLASQQKISTSLDYTTCYGILLNSSSNNFPLLSQYKSADNVFSRCLVQICTEFLHRIKVFKQIEIFEFQILPDYASGYEFKEHPHIFQSLISTNSLMRYLIFIPVLSPNLLSNIAISNILKRIIEGYNSIYIAQNFRFDCDKLYKFLASNIFIGDNAFEEFLNLKVSKQSLNIDNVGSYLKLKTKELLKGIETNIYLLYLNIHYILSFQRIIYDMLLISASHISEDSSKANVNIICLVHSIGAIRRTIELHGSGLTSFLQKYFAVEFSEQLNNIFLHANVPKFSEASSMLRGLKSLVKEEQDCSQTNFISILEAINEFEMLMMMNASYNQSYFAQINDILNSKYLLQNTADNFSYIDGMVDTSVITARSNFWIDIICNNMGGIQNDLNGIISFFCIKNRPLANSTVDSLQILYLSSEMCLRLLLCAIKDNIFPKFIKVPKLKVALTETINKPNKNKMFLRSFSQPEMNLQGSSRSTPSQESLTQSFSGLGLSTTKTIKINQMKPMSTVKSNTSSLIFSDASTQKAEPGRSAFLHSENIFPNISDQILLSNLFVDARPYHMGQKAFYIDVFGEKVLEEWLKECKKKLVELDSDKFCIAGFYLKFKIEIILNYHQIRSFLGHTSSFILNKLECYDDLVFCKFLNVYLLNSLKTYCTNIPDSKYIFSLSDESLFVNTSKKFEKSNIFNKKEFNYHLISFGLNISYSNLTLLVLLMKCYCNFLNETASTNSQSVLGFLSTNNQNLLNNNAIAEFARYLKTVGVFYFIYESCIKSFNDNLSLSQTKHSVDFIGSYLTKTVQYNFEANLLSLMNLNEDPQIANIFPVFAAASIISDFSKKKSKTLFVENFGGFINSQHHLLAGIKAYTKFTFKDSTKIDKIFKDILRNIKLLEKSTKKTKHSYLFLYKYFGHSSFVDLI